MRTKVRQAYETPLMERTQIEAEGTFAGSIVHDDGKGAAVETTKQNYESFDLSQEGSISQSGEGVIIWE